jgi:hypothetical protein
VSSPKDRGTASGRGRLERALHAPKLFNLRSDPFERAEEEAGDYVKWLVEHLFIMVPAQAIVAQHVQSFQEFPPRQEPGSVSVGGNTLAKSA